MSYNDPGFSTFWSQGNARTNPPTATTLVTGKSAAEDPSPARANETIGYIVIEAGSGTIDGSAYVAAVGADTVWGVTNTPPYNYAISGLTNVRAAVATLTAVDGFNGGWAILYGADPVSTSAINLAIDEDIAGDTERSHTTEQVAYIVFGDNDAPAGQIDFDNAASGFSGSNGSTLSWSHAIGGGNNRLLIVGVAAEDNVAANLNVNTVTYNGIPMLPVSGSTSTAGSGYLQRTALYYLLESDLPPAGAYPVVVTYSGSVDDRSGGSISLSNAAQQGAEAVGISDNTSTNTIATTVSAISAGAWVVDIAGCGNSGSLTPTGNGMTEYFDVSPDSSSAAGSTRELVTAGSVAMSWQHSGANRLAHSVAVFAPY